MIHYSIDYLDHSGLLHQAWAAGSTPADAMAKVKATEPRYLRAVRCTPRPHHRPSHPTPYCE